MNIRDKRRNILFLSTVNLLILITGILYLKYQNDLSDLGYIFLLILSSAILSFGYYQIKIYIHKKLTELISRTDDLEKKAIFQSIVNSFSLKRRTLLVFLGVFSISSFVSFYYLLLVGVWEEEVILKFYLSTFQFFVGIICALGLYSLIVFIQNIKNLSQYVPISFFHTHDPEIIFILNSTQSIALLTSIYVCMSTSAILCTDLFNFYNNMYVRYFSIFSFLCILIAYFVPLIPVSLRMRETKNKTLSGIEKRLSVLFEQEMNSEFSGTQLSETEALIKFRKEILSVHNWPFTMRWLTTSFSVFISAVIPITINKMMSG